MLLALHKNLNAPLGLRDEAEREEDAAQAAGTPDEEHLGLKTGRARLIVDEVGRRVADGPVPEPVGRDGERHRLGADLEREDLAGDDPRDGAPGRSKGGDIDADERDKRLLAGRVLDGNGDTDDGNCMEVSGGGRVRGRIHIPRYSQMVIMTAPHRRSERRPAFSMR